MKAILKINNKEIEVELSEEQIAKLTEKKDPFILADLGDMFFFIDVTGKVRKSFDNSGDLLANMHKVANYCTDKDLIQQQAYRETLNRLLWRWQYENDEFIDWNDHRVNKFNIHYDTINNEFITCWNDVCKGNTVYFSTEEKAYQAIEEVIKAFMAEHPDFVW